MKKDNSFIRAGAILVVSGFAVKLLSAAYRIPLTRMMGASTMGVYSSVFNVFMPFFSFATSGIIPTISRFTAQLNGKKDGGAITFLKRQAHILYVAVAGVMTAAYILFSRFYAGYMEDGIFFTGALILSPCIVMAASEMIYKGLSQGQMKMHITAAANVAEGAVKTLVGILAVYFVINRVQKNIRDMSVAACLFSVTLSSAVCLVYLVITGREKENAGIPKSRVTKKELIKMSAPISASALVISLVSFFDTAVCLPLIKKLSYAEIAASFEGASFMGAENISMYLFGIWQGMALTVFNLVPAVLASVGTACLPVMTKAQTMKDKTYLNRQSGKLFMVTAFISIPASAYIFCFRNEIITFLFDTTQGQTAIAAHLLALVIISCPFACFTSAFNSVIHSYGRSDVVFRILITASAVKCVLCGILCTVPQINIRAMAVSSAVFYTIIFVMSAAYTDKLGVKLNPVKTFARPAAVSAVMSAAVRVFANTQLGSLPLFLRLMMSGIIFCCGYAVVIFLTGFSVDI